MQLNLGVWPAVLVEIATVGTRGLRVSAQWANPTRLLINEVRCGRQGMHGAEHGHAGACPHGKVECALSGGGPRTARPICGQLLGLVAKHLEDLRWTTK